MRLFYSPGACSLGIHIILQELNIGHELARIDLKKGEQRESAFKQINPKGKVPALVRDDGTVLTEFQSIAYWLARSFPERGLIAEDFEGQIRTLELLDFMIATHHMRGFTLWLNPQRFVSDKEAQREVRENGLKVIHSCFDTLSDVLGEKHYLLGDFSVADAAFFFLARWATNAEISMPANINTLYQRLCARPAVVRALVAEGLTA